MRDINSPSGGDRSIRNIPVHHRRHGAAPHEEPAELRQSRKSRRDPRRGRGRLLLAGLAVVVVAALGGLLLSTVFAGASVSVTPRTAAVDMPASIPAQRSAPVGTLSYQTFSAAQSATTTVPATGTQQVSKQASGMLTIGNTGASQRLIANTRFEAPDGKIYRIHDSVVVPAGTGGKPGTASIAAYADSPGPDYNRSGNTNYTIPGFKGDPRYTKITAVSGAMTGGFVGSQPAVAAADLQKAKTTLEAQLNAAIQDVVVNDVPEGYTVVDGTVRISYSDIAQAPGSGNSASLSESATATGAVVRINDVAASVAKATLPSYGGEAITFANPDDITIAAATSTKPVADSLTILLGGTSPLQWIFDPNALKAALVGKPKAQFKTIIKTFQPAILKADASIRPFWTSSFPSNPDKISVDIETGK